MSKRNPNYRYYKDNAGNIIAVSSYAGHAVRGKAKCHPDDTFDEEFGKTLAKTRCDVKVANKRYNNAFRQYMAAKKAKDEAIANFGIAASRLTEARLDCNESQVSLEKLLESIQAN